jgi:hypothetical protein
MVVLWSFGTGLLLDFGDDEVVVQWSGWSGVDNGAVAVGVGSRNWGFTFENEEEERSYLNYGLLLGNAHWHWHVLAFASWGH